MIEQHSGDEDCQEATIKPNELPTDKTQESLDVSPQTINEPHSSAINDSLLEQSFEVISPSSVSKITSMDDHNDEEISSGGRMSGSSGQQANIDATGRSNSESRRSSFQDRIKKSGSFLSKLQSSADDADGPNNIQSSIVSAFSSFSSFTSNFTLNSPTNGNNTASSLTIETASTSTRLSQINETREDIFNRKAALERKNLISLTKLIVKDLISSSLLVSRTIDDCQNAVHLNNYFTLIDRCLKHGLKQNLLSNRSANLWTALDSLPKYLKESTLMSESVRSLTNTKTPDGKIKAWMRLAMMQKKLPEYFNELLANKNSLLKDIYHDYAFMLNDEAYVFTGLIIGVNVIDCNFFVKDANFDLIDDVIDLNPYLRVANCYDIEQVTDGTQSNDRSPSIENLTAVLDQKNYLEEWSKRLESTIANLQSKIKGLEERNSKLEMEAKLSEARISKMQGKQIDLPSDNSNSSKQTTNLSGSTLTDAIKSLMIGNNNNSNHSKQNDLTSANRQTDRVLTQSQVEGEETIDGDQPASVVASSCLDKEIDNEIENSSEFRATERPMDSHEQSKFVQDNSRLETQNRDLEKRLQEQEKELNSLKERASILEASYRGALEKIKVLERDLDVQTSMNADKDTTIKIYEKDIRDKQAQVESLRASLNDSKKLNSDLSERLNETSIKLKERVKIVSNLQASLDKWKLENKTLGSRLQDKQAAYKSVSSELEKIMKSMDELKKYNEKVNEELRMERKSGQSSSVTVETQNAQITELSAKIARLELELKDVKPYKNQTEELEKRCRDYELSLEEIGSQLRESRLEAENLKENSAVFLDSQWMDSKQAKTCALCQQSFSVTRRKHHCRLCGNVFCQTCSDNKMELASSAKPVRVCDTCHSFLLAKFVKSSSS